MWASAPTEALQEVRWEESPSHGFAVPAPFRQGGHGDGGTDCHNQFANWSRNDRVYKKCGERTGGGVRVPRPTERLQVGL